MPLASHSRPARRSLAATPSPPIPLPPRRSLGATPSPPTPAPAAPQARKLEEMVMMMAQRGQLREQLSDAQLKQMLEQIGGAEVRTSGPRPTALVALP